MATKDLGFTHVALTVSDLDKSIAFYSKYAAMQAIHRRTDAKTNAGVAWLSDLTRPFVIVLIKAEAVNSPLRPISHLGVACATRDEVDRLCEEARQEGIEVDGPQDWPPPVGYWAFLRDPDGHTLELSYGQEIGFTVEEAGQ
jgi:catechol 2,3-dioxygenase-like lactoylglutathione lyase family enzyme